MKRSKIYILVAVSLLSNFGFAQKSLTDKTDNIAEIVLEFDNMKLSDLPELKEGEFYRFKVENINLNLYKVSINHNDTTISQAIEVPTFTSLPIDGLSDLVQKLGGITITESSQFETWSQLPLVQKQMWVPFPREEVLESGEVVKLFK